jgi:hypothetical protein
MDTDSIIILRCCRDWPVHAYCAYATSGRCGICREIPEVINEPYFGNNAGTHPREMKKFSE